MALTQDQIDDLLELSLTRRPAVAAYWKVTWDANDANETRYYANASYHQMGPYFNVGVELDARIIGSVISDLSFEINPDLRTEEIPIVFDDIDKEITGRFQQFNSGVAIELIFFYPDVQGSQSVWFGQLQAPEVYGWKQLATKATNGFRSRELLLPGSNHPVSHCRFASTFGPLLPDLEAVRTSGCPYDLDKGGSTGNLNPDTSQPFGHCPGDKAACHARLGSGGDDPDNPRYYGGFEADVAPVVTDPDTGHLARTQGNASNLVQPLRVIAGTKYVRSLPILVWRRDPNDDPDTGWFDVIHEVSDGPNLAINNFKINEKLVEHITIRLGERGQPQTGFSPDVPFYSGTSVVESAYGQVNPADYSPSNIYAECLVSGFRDVAGFNPTSASGTGALAKYFDDSTWTNEVGQRIVYNISFPATIQPPLGNINILDRFSFRITGTITFEHSETYTMSVLHQGGAKLIINGSTIVNQLGTNGTHTGTFAATAGTPYSFQMDFVRNPSSIIFPSTWSLTLKWNSTSQPIEVVPNSAFGVSVGTSDDHYRSWTDDRVNWLLESFTNQKWGMRYPFSRMHVDSWNHTQATLAQYVRFTHTHPDGEERDYSGRRSTFNAVLEGRPCAEQITDICRSGGMCVPFQHDGKFYLRPFRPASADELTNAYVFTDTGDTRNIPWDNGQPAIELSQVPNDKIVNEIVLRYEEGSNFDIERPITVNDPDQQLLAGRTLGSNNLQRVPMNFVGFGIRHLNEAVRLGYRLLYFGEFDEGGIQNNLRIRLQTPFEQTLGLKRYDIIKIESALLNGFSIGTDNGAVDLTETPEYFRIIEMHKIPNGRVEITAQAYNHTAYEAFEVVLESPSTPGEEPGNPVPSPNPEEPVPTPGPSEPPTDLPRLPLPDMPAFTALTYDSNLRTINVEVGV